MFSDNDKMLQEERDTHVLMHVLPVSLLVLVIGCAPPKDVPVKPVKDVSANSDLRMLRAHVDNGDKPGYWIFLTSKNDQIVSGAVELTAPGSLLPVGIHWPIVIKRSQGNQMEGEITVTTPGRKPPSPTPVRIVLEKPVADTGEVPAVIHWSLTAGDGIALRFSKCL